MSGPIEEVRPDYVGDGYDPERLMTAEEVAEVLRVPRDAVYEMEIPRVRVGKRRIRWRPADVREFIQNRVEDP